MNNFEDIDFYLVTDSELSKNGIFSDVENAIKAGCKIVQYREKNKSAKEMINEAIQLKKICEGKAIFLGFFTKSVRKREKIKAVR